MNETPRRPRAWFRGRSYALGAQLDTFLVCAAAGVVVNRAILIVLGYPQIGSRSPGGIHISHSIYGGFAMMVAATVAIAFLAPATHWFVAIVGGLGFGWYVDEPRACGTCWPTPRHRHRDHRAASVACASSSAPATRPGATGTASR